MKRRIKIVREREINVKCRIQNVECKSVLGRINKREITAPACPDFSGNARITLRPPRKKNHVKRTPQTFAIQPTIEE